MDSKGAGFPGEPRRNVVPGGDPAGRRRHGPARAAAAAFAAICAITLSLPFDFGLSGDHLVQFGVKAAHAQGASGNGGGGKGGGGNGGGNGGGGKGGGNSGGNSGGSGGNAGGGNAGGGNAGGGPANPGGPDGRGGDIRGGDVSPPSGPIDWGRLLAQPDAAEVALAQVTTTIRKRYPADEVKTLGDSHQPISFFTEIRGMPGKDVTHRWYHGDVVVYHTTFRIRADRWRVWSTQKLPEHMAGEWMLVAVDGGNHVLAVRELMYRPGGADAVGTGKPPPGRLQNVIDGIRSALKQ